MKTNAQNTESAEATHAFADLTKARATLALIETTARSHLNALRRFARQHGLRLRAARRKLWQDDIVAALALANAERAHTTALGEFRRVALIAALTRVVETDRRLSVAA